MNKVYQKTVEIGVSIIDYLSNKIVESFSKTSEKLDIWNQVDGILQENLFYQNKHFRWKH